jgi:hypothetical protein
MQTKAAVKIVGGKEDKKGRFGSQVSQACKAEGTVLMCSRRKTKPVERYRESTLRVFAVCTGAPAATCMRVRHVYAIPILFYFLAICFACG